MKKKIRKFAEGGEPLNLSDEARGVLNLDLGARMTKEKSDYWSKRPQEFGLLKKLSDINPSNGMERLLKIIGSKSLGLGFKKGGKVKSKTKHKCTRGDGCAKRGKTKGRMI